MKKLHSSFIILPDTKKLKKQWPKSSKIHQSDDISPNPVALPGQKVKAREMSIRIRQT